MNLSVAVAKGLLGIAVKIKRANGASNQFIAEEIVKDLLSDKQTVTLDDIHMAVELIAAAVGFNGKQKEEFIIHITRRYLIMGKLAQ